VAVKSALHTESWCRY